MSSRAASGRRRIPAKKTSAQQILNNLRRPPVDLRVSPFYVSEASNQSGHESSTACPTLPHNEERPNPCSRAASPFPTYVSPFQVDSIDLTSAVSPPLLQRQSKRDTFYVLSPPNSTESNPVSAPALVPSLVRTRSSSTSSVESFSSLDVNAPASLFTLSCESLAPSPSAFVFPSSRSRAHPNATPAMAKVVMKSKAEKVLMSEAVAERIKARLEPVHQAGDFVFPSSRSRAHPSASRPRLTKQLKKKSKTLQASVNANDATRNLPSSSRMADTYPLDPHDPILLEQDRLTTDLLQELIGSPSVHKYGDNPPATVLDLGCGQGYWMLHAAIAWKGYGTKVTGFDMVDLTHPLHALAVQHEIVDNTTFVEGNFITSKLPFPNNSFDLVRMANLTYAIPFEKWDFVLNEVCRVLTVGGRLEIIDDHVFFPYGKLPAIQGSSPDPNSDLEVSRGPTITTDEESYNTEADSTISPSNSQTSVTSTSSDPWIEQTTATKELESVFEQLNNSQFGIHLSPSQFVVEMAQKIFGQARELRTIHLLLAPPQLGFTDESHQLTHSPGLVLWPSTFIPLPRTEIEVHALKHPRVLLSLKYTLMDFAGEEVEDALWDYEGFLHERFNPREASSYVPESSDTGSTLDSVFSVPSISSESWSDIPDYQCERQHYQSLSVDDTSDSMSFIPSVVETGAPSIVSLPSFTTLPPAGSAVPPEYSRYEPAHVRTFHIYEAIKMGESMAATAR
ncbi:uncharacterized protein EV420DRAFT_1480856 [Desarmillaria tabescens]|uniref:Methyltransferase domain-containing protein n=1 Tax=Armillaria tabescens TaxID=1929756 RepID=A0AA39N493_ARMTA|nr:uncharacterized protein EV420DRAFT_1480856 [Desarmillaria tabescens]KAK0457382.1 hypothetical protein EV420DRAFT_1480856 [Desarmillaria tabescens]